MFGEDFLLKLGVDTDNKEVKELIKLVKQLQSLEKKTKTIKAKVTKSQDKRVKAKNKEIQKEKQLLNLKRKRLQYQKKLAMAEKMGMSVNRRQFRSPTGYSKITTLDNKILDLDKSLTEFAVQQNKTAKLEKLKREQERAALAKQKALDSAKNKEAARQAAIAKRISIEKTKELMAQKRAARMWKKTVNDFAHTFSSMAAVLGVGFAVAQSQATKIGLEQARVQMDVAFGKRADSIVDNFVSDIRGLNLGIGELQSTEAVSKIMPALKNRFAEKDSLDISKNLLLAGKLFGQLPHMSEVSRNFAQIATSFEMEDINQFRDRFTALVPMIEDQLVKQGSMSRGTNLKRAKEAGQITRDDFLKSFQIVMGKVSKDKNLQQQLSSTLFVSWNQLIASLEDSRLQFMGKISDKGVEKDRNSLAEALFNAYKTLADVLQVNRHTFRNFGEVIADIVDFLVDTFLNLQIAYYKFAMFLKNMFGLTDDQAEQMAIWLALTPLLLSFAAIITKVVLALGKLFKFLGITMSLKGLTSSLAVMVSSFKGFAIVVGGIASSLSAVWLGLELLASFVKGDGGKSMAKGFGISLPDWMFSTDWDKTKSLFSGETPASAMIPNKVSNSGGNITVNQTNQNTMQVSSNDPNSAANHIMMKQREVNKASAAAIAGKIAPNL